MKSVHGSPKAWKVVNSRKRKKKKSLMECYQNRNDRLSELGLSYQDYLDTEEWKVIRSRVLKARPDCLLCRGKASQVHHMDYEWDTLLGTCLDGLTVLCRKCHKGIEFDGDRKRDLEEANSILLIGIGSQNTPESQYWLAVHRKRCKVSKRIDKRIARSEEKRVAKRKWERYLLREAKKAKKKAEKEDNGRTSAVPKEDFRGAVNRPRSVQRSPEDR